MLPYNDHSNHNSTIFKLLFSKQRIPSIQVTYITITVSILHIHKIFLNPQNHHIQSLRQNKNIKLDT